MAFDAYTVALELITALRAPLSTLQRCNRPLAGQLRRAAESVALNIGEGARRCGRDREHFYRIAAGSAAEVRAGLDVACAWGHLNAATITPARALLDRELAMLWRLTHHRAA